MSDESKPFIVNDRRHFTQDGEVRLTEEEAASEDVQTTVDAPDRAGSPSLDAPAGSDAGEAITFMEFLVSLGAQGAALLMEEAEAGSVEDRAAGVRHFIGLLEMLRDKTEGRRTAEEEQVLSQLLFELRTGYLTHFRAS